MNKALISAIILSLCLTGCFDFNKTNLFNGEKEKLAMDNSTHLKFKGVPIDGTLNKFVSRMESEGFERAGRKDDTVILKGDFAGFKNCIVYVNTLDNKDLVSKISVAFPAQEKWEYLYGNYKSMKDLLTEKYGEPSECIEMTKYKDDDMMFALKYENAKYETTFKTDKGNITLWIEPDEYYSCSVMLSYKDKENGKIIREQAKNDL